MLAKRIIPCLDIKDGRTVKGVNFEGLRDAGDPVELAVSYMQLGADELVFLDITATNEKRKTLSELVLKISKKLAIPFTVGGGISSVEDVRLMLENGADKVSINSAAVKRPELISEIASTFGNQCVVVAADAKLLNGQWKIHLNGGKLASDINLLDWVKEAETRGAGEILFTSMDHDGTKDGFANEILHEISTKIKIPVIASGGAGKKEDFLNAFSLGNADAALAASVFHFKEISIPELKRYLGENGIAVRL
jgi:cyclase